MSMIFDEKTRHGFDLLRTIGPTACGAAEIGECLPTALHVVEGDDACETGCSGSTTRVLLV